MPSDPPMAVSPVPPPVATPDPLLLAALSAVAPAFRAWHSALAGAADEVRGILSRRGSAVGVASTLGVFGAGRIDLVRFAGLVERGDALDSAALDALQNASAVLLAAATDAADTQIVVRVPDGASMRDVVGVALARLGRAFGAARVAGLAQQGRYRPEADRALLEALPPRAWTKRERRVAPPLVVSVAGADLDATSLVEALDGAAKVVLLVRGSATPAPLVRLVTPGTFVLQAADATGLDAFGRAAGPAVAAILPDAAESAAFVHDPAAGPTLADRLVVRRLPTAGPRSPVGGWSSAQQAEELAQLAALAERPRGARVATPDAPLLAAATAPAAGRPHPAEAPAPAAVAASAPDDPAGRLAAWLLGTVDLRDVRG